MAIVKKSENCMNLYRQNYRKQFSHSNNLIYSCKCWEVVVTLVVLRCARGIFTFTDDLRQMVIMSD